MHSLADLARALHVDLSPAQLNAFDIYFRELVAWNARMNLTSITDPEQVTVKHFVDSLSAVPLICSATALVDIDSGAGFPGIPLKIALPSLHVTLLEATRKKVDFLKHMIATLSLRDASAIQSRAEDAGRDPVRREQYDVAVARAVADLAVLSEYALPLVRMGGIFVAYKGVDVEAEVQNAGRALKLLGGRVRETVPVHLPGLEPRHLIVIEKVGRTPPAYPRRAGLAVQKPLR